MRPAYYNENDAYMAAWLRGLIAANLIAPGEVDERSITDVCAEDLRGFGQCHFFAGAGIWSYGLRAVGVPDDEPIWSGSCPCQPFSQAGARKGEEDARDLWPVWRKLIKEIRPKKIIGEQVASSEVVGTKLEDSFVVAVRSGDFARANKLAKQLFASRSFGYRPRWVDRLQADLAAENYAFRFTVLGAHSAGSYSRRQRVVWMADADCKRRNGVELLLRENESGGKPDLHQAAGCGVVNGLAHSDQPGLEGLTRHGDGEYEPGRIETEAPGLAPAGGDAVEWLWCHDGKYRPVEPGLEPLAHGYPRDVAGVRAELLRMGFDTKSIRELLREPRRVLRLARKFRAGVLHGYGNAVHGGVAKLFCEALIKLDGIK